MELIGDKQFVSSVMSCGGLWVLMFSGSAYMLRAPVGHDLPVWESRDQAIEFCKASEFDDFKPVYIPLATFVEVWLESEKMNIEEVLASPKYNFDALSYSKDELIAKFKT